MVDTNQLQPQNKPLDLSQGAGVVAPAAGNAFTQSEQKNTFEHTKIKSNFTQSPSTYWALALPLLSARYVAEAVDSIFDGKRKFKEAAEKAAKGTLGAVEATSNSKEKAWATAVGTGMILVTGIYTGITYGDMKRQFAEPLAWEFNKPPEKVGLLDMLKSKNVLVHEAVHNLISRTVKRFAAHIPFFAFQAPALFKQEGKSTSLRNPFSNENNYIKSDGLKYDKLMTPKDAVNFGVGTNAFYLASDALGRKRTFFEELQHLIEVKINHSDRLGEIVTSQDLLNLYDRQARKNKNATPLPKMDSPEWRADMKLFERMADLMNQTYGNTPKQGEANFTVPKLIYLLGMELEKSDSPEKNLAYVEVANRYGIPAIRKISAAVRDGETLDAALAAFPVEAKKTAVDAAFPSAPADNMLVASTGAAPEPAASVFEKTFARGALKKALPPPPAASHLEKAAQSRDGSPAMLGVG